MAAQIEKVYADVGGFGYLLLFGFDYGAGGGYQFELQATWIKALGVGYHVGLDGISLPLVELTLLTTFLCAVYSLNRMPSGGSAKAFISLMLLLETVSGQFVEHVRSQHPLIGRLGTIVALDDLRPVALLADQLQDRLPVVEPQP